MDRKFAGITARGNSIQIDFTYQGERCRESLNIKPTKTSLLAAANKREALKYAIAMGNFEYSDFFPDSRRAIKYSKYKGKLITIESALKKWLKSSESRCEYSTLKDYGNIICNQLIPEFGHLSLSELSLTHIDEWQYTLTCGPKRLKNLLGPLRQTFKDAYYDGLIDQNPLDRLRPIPIKQREPKPFTLIEIISILNQLSGQEHNLIEFAFWSGLRTSELIALRWEDIDFDNNRFYVRVAIVGGREKTTKTAAGKRTVDLNPQSEAALKAQLPFTNDTLRVFNDPKHNRPWKNDGIIRKRVWIPALKNANVEYRNPYQTRHTFASMMYSQGRITSWLASQMGHNSSTMLEKVYARYIPQE